MIDFQFLKMFSKNFFFKLIVLVLIVKLNLVFCLDKNIHCTCKTKVQPNIVGGRKTKLSWIASVTDSGFHKNNPHPNQPNDEDKIKDHKCTAFVLNESWVITSKKCTQNESSVYSVGFGNDKVEMFNKRIEVEQVIRHDDPQVDISLLKLAEPIDFDENLRPACIDIKQYEYIQRKHPILKAAGFGKTVPYLRNSKNSNILFYKKEMKMHLPEDLAGNIDSRYLKEVEMIDTTGNVFTDQILMIYAENAKPNHTVCLGDEGGPLYFSHRGKQFVLGLLTRYQPESTSSSDVKNYCEGTTKANYHRIAAHITWIENHLGKDNYCDDNMENKGESSTKKKLTPNQKNEDDPKGKRVKLFGQYLN